MNHRGNVGACVALAVMLLFPALGLRAQTSAGPTQPATLTLAVLDPLGQPAADVQVVFEQAALQDGMLFGDGRTDQSGSYTIRLPAGTYVFTGTTDFFPATRVTLAAGETVRHEIRMNVEPVGGSFTICIDCQDEQPNTIARSVIEEWQRDRTAAATELIQEAEPAGGWEAFRLAAPVSLRLLDPTVQGTVVVEGRIERDGRVASLRVVDAAHPELAAAALTALQQQRWEPARLRGVPLEVPLRLTLRYVRNTSPVAAQSVQRFEVVSVKPNRSGQLTLGVNTAANRFTATNVPIQLLIRLAYAVPEHRIVGAPDWARTERFDIAATSSGTPSPDERNRMLRSLLEERFQLVARMETRELPIYALVRARQDGRMGPNLRPAVIADCAGLLAARAKGQPLPPSNRILCGSSMRPGGLSVGGMTMVEIAGGVFSPQLERLVVDRTGLMGAYDFDLDFIRGGATDGPQPQSAPSIFTAVQEQLGLRLEPTTGPVDVLVIVNVERPSPD